MLAYEEEEVVEELQDIRLNQITGPNGPAFYNTGDRLEVSW